VQEEGLLGSKGGLSEGRGGTKRRGRAFLGRKKEKVSRRKGAFSTEEGHGIGERGGKDDASALTTLKPL